MKFSNFGEMGCTRASTVSSEDIVDVALSLVEGREVCYGQLVKVHLKFTANRNFSNLGAVLRIFDRAGRCAFSSCFTDLDGAAIAPSISSGQHLVVAHFIAALPAGWYALTFSLSENCSGNFTDPGAWVVIEEQTCYTPFFVSGDERTGEKTGYCQIPAHVYFGASGAVASFVGRADSFPEFPWSLDQSLYSMTQVIAALHRVIPELSLGVSLGTGAFRLASRQPELRFQASDTRFHTQVGLPTDSGLISSGQAGALLFGPYLPAEPGRYVATFLGASTGDVLSLPVADVVASQGALVLGRTELSSVDNSLVGTIHFVVDDPGVTDLEFRVFVEAGTKIEIQEVVVGVFEEENLLEIELRKALKWSLPVREPVVIVLVPSVYWLPFALSISDESFRRFGKRSVFVYIQDHPIFNQVEELSTSVIGALNIQSVSNVIFLDVFSVVAHDFAWRNQANLLLRNYQGAQHWVYVDGFRGELCHPAHHLKSAEVAFFFGHVLSNPAGVEEVILPTSEVARHIKTIASKDKTFDPGEPTSPESTSFAVLYMRYWGVGVYSIDVTEIVNSILTTIRDTLPDGMLLVVKDDPRVSREVLGLLLTRLSESGVPWVMLDGYFESIGIDGKYASLDAAYLFSKGLLISAGYHFVFDSTVGFYIAEALPKGRATSIVFGALNSEWSHLRSDVIGDSYIDYILRSDAGLVNKTSNGALSIIRHYSEKFAEAVCSIFNVNSDEVSKVVKLSDTCYVSQFNK